MPRQRASDDPNDGPGYVLDFQTEYGHFVHVLDTPRRAELLARMLMTVFSGNDRGDQAPDAYRFFTGEAELNAVRARHGQDIPLVPFAGKMPSLAQAQEQVQAAANENGRDNQQLRGSDLQDALFNRLRNFFAEILPPQTLAERRAAAAAQAGPQAVLTEDQM
jgi:hypothetical protein